MSSRPCARTTYSSQSIKTNTAPYRKIRQEARFRRSAKRKQLFSRKSSPTICTGRGEDQMSHVTAVGTISPVPRSAQAKALFAGIVGNILEWYDFAIYAFLVPTLSKLFFAEKNQAIAILLTLAVFGSGFVARPLGALVF